MQGWKREGMSSDQLQQYCKRIGASDEVLAKATQKQADMDLLKEIITLQLLSVPFENLGLMYPPAKEQDHGKVKTDLESLMQKIVHRRRGGYCFEANEILAQALTGMGFTLHTAAGRIVLSDGHRQFPGEILMTRIEHELLIVHLEGENWICDAGQGSATPLEPVLLTEQLLEREQTENKGGAHRVRRGLLGIETDINEVNPRVPEREGWYMQKYSEKRQKWHDLYFFTEQEWRTEDYDPPNLWCSFDHNLFNHTKTGRKTISDDKMRLFEGEKVTEIELNSQEALQDALKQQFGLVI